MPAIGSTIFGKAAWGKKETVKAATLARNPTREEAWAIPTEHVKSPGLLSHALAVEAVMRHVARKRGADVELWGVIGR
jgi:predicted hydrolase (HD superfamily)